MSKPFGTEFVLHKNKKKIEENKKNLQLQREDKQSNDSQREKQKLFKKFQNLNIPWNYAASLAL